MRTKSQPFVPGFEQSHGVTIARATDPPHVWQYCVKTEVGTRSRDEHELIAEMRTSDRASQVDHQGTEERIDYQTSF
ncbi:hypothetical protein ACVMB0_000246 [Bradyrhizobium sp. USDA 4451]